MDEMVGKGLGWSLIGELIFYASFGLLPMVFPISMLISSIMTFGSLGENYELVAIKSSGISLFRIMRPLIILAILISFIAFYFANYILPKTNLKVTTLILSIREQKPDLILKEGVFTNEIDGYSIRIENKNKKTNLLYDVLIYDHTNRRSNLYNVTRADSGLIKMTEDKKYMVLTLYNGINYREGESNNRGSDNNYPRYEDKFKEQVLRIKLKDFEFTRQDESVYQNNYRMLRINQLSQYEDSMHVDYRRRVRTFLSQINLNSTLKSNLLNLTVTNDTLRRKWKFTADTLVNIDKVFAGLEYWKKQDVMSSVVGEVRQNDLALNNSTRVIFDRKKLINRYEIERHKKFTLSLAVLIFFFIGAPLGAIIRKGGLGMPVVVSIFLFIIYYILSMMGEKSAREDVWDMLVGSWFSSVIFLIIGVWLTYKAVTDSGIMSAETYTDYLKKLKLPRFLKRSIIPDENTSNNE